MSYRTVVRNLPQGCRESKGHERNRGKHSVWHCFHTYFVLSVADPQGSLGAIPRGAFTDCGLGRWICHEGWRGRGSLWIGAGEREIYYRDRGAW